MNQSTRDGHEPGCVLSHAPGEGRCADLNFDYLPKAGPVNEGKPLLSMGDVCKLFVQLAAGKQIEVTELDAQARKFFDASPTGELMHVFAASERLIEEGYLVSVEGGTQRTEKELPWE